MRKPTIYEALAIKLGREPTREEVKADVRRILTEVSTQMAKAGKLPRQKRRRSH